MARTPRRSSNALSRGSIDLPSRRAAEPHYRFHAAFQPLTCGDGSGIRRAADTCLAAQGCAVTLHPDDWRAKRAPGRADPRAPGRDTRHAKECAMLTDFQRSKLDRRFELLDADGDGYIAASDYELAAAGVCRALDHAEGSPQHERIRLGYLNLWERLSRGIDQEGAQRITRAQFAAAFAQNIVEPEDGYDRALRPVVEDIIEVVDGGGRGVLEVERLAAWFNAYGVCIDDAERAFAALDRNGDGVMDPNEVHKAIQEYYTSDDPEGLGNRIFGPLPGAVTQTVRQKKARIKAAAAH
jgi:Ca2+-binding EF-hand superfamily protein